MTAALTWPPIDGQTPNEAERTPDASAGKSAEGADLTKVMRKESYLRTTRTRGEGRWQGRRPFLIDQRTFVCFRGF